MREVQGAVSDAVLLKQIRIKLTRMSDISNVLAVHRLCLPSTVLNTEYCIRSTSVVRFTVAVNYRPSTSHTKRVLKVSYGIYVGWR